MTTNFMTPNTEPVYTTRDVDSREKLISLVQKLCDKVNDHYRNIESFVQKNNTDRFDPHRAKLYLRVYKPTGHWYIGSTVQRFATFRHYEDIVRTYYFDRTDSQSKICQFYRGLKYTAKQLDDLYRNKEHPNYVFDENWAIVTIAQTECNKKLVNTIEKEVIDLLTTPQKTRLPVELHLNTIHAQDTNKTKPINTQINPILERMFAKKTS